MTQSSIVSIYSLPDVTKSAGCDADRSRGWMLREGGARAAFLDSRESATDSSSTLVCTLREHGIFSAARQWIASVESNDGLDKNKLIAFISKALAMSLSAFRFSTTMFSKLYPHHSLPPEDIIAEFSSSGPSWSSSKVRAVDWHPHALKLAVASMDDALRVFYGGSDSGKSLVPTLKHPRQKNVSCIRWRPLSASGLAVAAQDGVILWKVDPNSLSSRPASSCVTFLTLSGHRPVTSLAWSRDGLTLFSASPCDNRVTAWDVTRADGAPTPLISITGGGITLLSLSPSGKLLLTATPSLEFRVWNSGGDWRNEKWTCLLGRLKTAAWSPDGAALLFATEADSVIYAIDFKTNWHTDRDMKGDGIDTAGEARAVLDLAQLELVDSDVEMSLTGAGVHQLAWDHTGERLAVALEPQTGHAGAVAVFSVRSRSVSAGTWSVDFLPVCVIRSNGGDDERTNDDGGGNEEPYAASISFCPSLPPGSEPPWSPGVLLVVAWAVSGRISYHPLHFLPTSSSGPTSMLNSSLASSKFSCSQSRTLPHDMLSSSAFLGDSFHSLNASLPSKSQLFSTQD